MRTIEMLGAFFGILSVWLLSKQNKMGWPIGILYIVLAILLFFQNQLYGELAAHFVFLVLSLYGWWNWVRGSKETSLSVSSILTSPKTPLLFILALLLSLASGLAFQHFTDNRAPFIDGLIMVLSFTAMWLSAQKIIENWHLWIFVNALSIGLYLNQELYVYMVLYCIFFAQAFHGLSSWKRVLGSTYVQQQ